MKPKDHSSYLQYNQESQNSLLRNKQNSRTNKSPERIYLMANKPRKWLFSIIIRKMQVLSYIYTPIKIANIFFLKTDSSKCQQGYSATEILCISAKFDRHSGYSLTEVYKVKHILTMYPRNSTPHRNERYSPHRNEIHIHTNPVYEGL